MRITFSNNPIDKLSCYLDNKKEELSRVRWLMGKHKEVECRICGDVLDSSKDTYSPIQCGWHRVGKYSWICHRCMDHRNFRPFIEMIDEADQKFYEERNIKVEQIKLKAQEVINLLKEYLPEYKETLDLYTFYGDLDYYDGNGYPTEVDFSFAIIDKNEEYVLEIRNTCILKTTVHDKTITEVANYLDEEIDKQRTFENPWSWNDAIEVIKSRLNKEK